MSNSNSKLTGEQIKELLECGRYQMTLEDACVIIGVKESDITDNLKDQFTRAQKKTLLELSKTVINKALNQSDKPDSTVKGVDLCKILIPSFQKENLAVDDIDQTTDDDVEIFKESIRRIKQTNGKPD